MLHQELEHCGMRPAAAQRRQLCRIGRWAGEQGGGAWWRRRYRPRCRCCCKHPLMPLGSLLLAPPLSSLLPSGRQIGRTRRRRCSRGGSRMGKGWGCEIPSPLPLHGTLQGCLGQACKEEKGFLGDELDLFDLPIGPLSLSLHFSTTSCIAPYTDCIVFDSCSLRAAVAVCRLRPVLQLLELVSRLQGK